MMSDCDCQKNIKKPAKPTVDATASKKAIGDGPLIATVAATTAVIFFGLKVVGMGQDKTLLTSTSLVYLLSLFWSDD